MEVLQYRSCIRISNIIAMYKTSKTGTGNGMQGTREMGKYYIPSNVDKYSYGMSPNIRDEFSRRLRGI